MPRPVVALLAAALAALVLAACGGGDSSTSESASTSASVPSAAAKRKLEALKAKVEKKKATEAQQAKDSPNSESPNRAAAKAVPPLKVSGGGSAQFRTKGGDNSIQNYGEEDESELREVAEALHGFYVARAGEEWERACSYLTSSTAKQFEQLASRSPQLKGEGCGAALHAFTRPLPASLQRELTLVDAVSLRREGERAFLIYRGGENKVYVVPMQREGSGWKVGSIAGTPLD